MRRIELTITFIDEDETKRTKSAIINLEHTTDADGESRLFHILRTDLSVSVGKQIPPKHNATARSWLEFPNQPTEFHQIFDVQNSQAMWLELSNLVMGSEADLIHAHAYKALEPTEEVNFEDDAALNHLYFIHDSKMRLLNSSVQDLVKVQDLINRLLHESLGGDLVDTSRPDWEKKQLTRDKVRKRLDERCANGTLLQEDYDVIIRVLEIPENMPGTETAISYRNRLMHHIRPAVDYPMFFTILQSRVGEEIRDARGNLVGRRHLLRVNEPADYSFTQLFESCSEYLDAVVAMLDGLSKIELLRR